MAIKTKFDYEMESFKKNFESFRDKKIVLYGTGRMTATFIERNTEFHIIGLCDREVEAIGQKKYGIPVIDRAMAEKMADLVIINTSETYWNTIYKRISDWKVPIYFLNGKLASQCVRNINREDNPYWEKSYEELEILCQQYDIVSFDIYDTLFMRKTMLSADIFKLVESKLQLKEVDFVSVRKLAASMLDNPTIHDIYKKIAELTKKSQMEIEAWKQEEISTEKKMIIARKDMVMLCQRLMQSKQVYLISDMYFTKEILLEILSEAGLAIDKNRLIVSCDFKMTKEDGSLWEYYKNKIVGDKKGLHIGDNGKGDYQKAIEHGIDAFRVMSAYELLENSAVREIIPETESLYSSIAMGIISAKIFNSPFVLNETNGQIAIKREEDVGYMLFGPVMDCFNRWLIAHSMEQGYKQLAFFAREGFLMIPLYQKMVKLLEASNAPEPVYLEISRRAVGVASIQKEEDIYEIGNFPYEGSWKDFLKDRFGVDVLNDGDEGLNFKQLMERFAEDILAESRAERKGYLEYIDNLNLEKTAYVDSQYYGSTQYYLGKILNKRLEAYYLCACMDESNRYLDKNIMHGCFQGRESNIHKQAQFLEAYFTSPEGMLQYIAPNGEKVFSEKMLNQKNFDIRYEMQDGIKAFMGDMADVMKEYYISDKTMDSGWADKWFGYLMGGGFIATENMRKSFYFDNKIVNKKEMPIWE